MKGKEHSENIFYQYNYQVKLQKQLEKFDMKKF